MVSIGPKIQITGETAYRQALNRIISETKALNSEMDLMVAKFSKSDSAIEKNKQKQEMLTRQIEQAKKQYDSFKDALEKANEKFTNATKKYDESKQKLDKLYETQDKYKKGLELVERAGQKYTTTWQTLNEKLDATNKEIAEAEDSTSKLSKEVDRSAKVMADWQTATNNAEIELQNLKHELKDVPNSFQTVGESMQKWGDAMTQVGEKLTMYITAPLTAAGTAFVKWASDFTDGMAKIYTIADEGKKPMSEMREELIQLSNQSGYSLEDLAEAEYQAVSASVDTSKAVTFLTDATRLARGGFTSTTQAVDLLTTVINAYGYEAEDAAYISDVLLRTQNDGKTIVDELAHSMGTVIPTAANYNVSLEQLAAAYATMTKQGVNTSRATTFLNAMFTELEKESSTIAKTLDAETGKSFAQLMAEGKSLADVLGILYNAVDGDNEQFQRMFGNIRSGKAAAALLTDDFAILNYEVERMRDALGQTDHALEVLETPSLKAKRAIQQLKNSGMELGATLINTLAPTFEKFINSIKNLTDSFAQLDEHQLQLILAFGAVAAAAAPMLTIFGKITTAIGTFMAHLAEGALPLTTIVGMITAGALAFSGLAVATEIAAESHRNEIAALWGMDEKMRESIDLAQQSAEAYDQRKTAIYDELNASLEDIDVAQRLIDKYNELIDDNGEVREGHEQLAEVYFNQLAQALGMETEDLRALVEENGRFGESVQKTIEDIKARAEAAAYEKILTDAIYRETEAQMELEKQEASLTAQQAKVKQATKETEDAYNAMIEAQKRGDPEIGRYEQAWRDAVEAESQAKASEAELQSAIEQTRKEVKEAQADADAAAQHISTNAQTTMKDTANAIKTGGEKVVTEAGTLSRRAESQLSIDGDNIGYQIDSGLASGISRYSYLVQRSAAQLAYEANHSLRGALSINSPSKVTAEAGKYFSQGFAVGIEDMAKQAVQAANMLANAAAGGIQMIGFEPNETRISAPISISS